jgi:ABC-type lipoprotein export system ATPase subunit
MNDGIVRAIDLRRRFGSGDAAVDAVAGVTLSIEAGAMTAIMGPSGSGKSTLMQLLAGLDRPTGGSVQMDGVALERLGDRALTLLRHTVDAFGQAVVIVTHDHEAAAAADRVIRLRDGRVED